MLGLYDGEVRAPFSPDSLAALDQLGQWLKLAPDSPKLLRLTGHFIPLLHRLNEVGKLSERILTFQLSPTLIAADIRKDLKEERGITEKDTDLQKKESQALQELEELESKVLGREKAELQAIKHRRENKEHSLKRLSNLLKATHALLRQLWKKHLQTQRLQQREQKRLERKLEVRQILIEQMKQTYEELEDVTKRRKLRKQIKAREKVLEIQEDKLNQKQKKWARQKKRREKSISNQQKDLRSYQEDIKRLRAKINGLRFRFKGQLKRSLSTSTFSDVQKEVFRSNDLAYLQTLEKEAYNSFLIRILQLSQWVNGYYIGKIDSQFEGKTFGAIVEMVEDLPRLRLKYILTCLPDEQEGYWVLNIAYLIDHFCKIYPVNETLPSPDEVLERYSKAFISSDPLYHTPATEACWEEWEGEQLACAYHGRNRLWASMGRVVKKFAAFVWRGVKATAHIFRNFIRLLYEDIRESVVL